MEESMGTAFSTPMSMETKGRAMTVDPNPAMPSTAKVVKTMPPMTRTRVNSSMFSLPAFEFFYNIMPEGPLCKGEISCIIPQAVLY